MRLGEDSAFRAYMLTGNNPQHLVEGLEIDFDTAGPADLRDGLRLLIEVWICGDRNHKARDPEINGVCAVFERGESGTPHAHLWICSRNPIRFKSLKKRFQGFHIDVLRGSEQDARDYMYKRGAHAGKAFTQLCEPVEWGDYFCANGSTAGAEKMHDVADRLIREGMTPNQIILEQPRFARFDRMLNALYAAYVQENVPTFRKVFVEWHLGRSGAGKTHSYLELCSRYGADNVYLLSGTSKHPWDGYVETMSKVVIDELRATTFDPSELLSILDGYRVSLNARYHDRLAAWDELHITSIIPPEELWARSQSGASERDTSDQLLRRIDTITYHYIDARFEGSGRYRRISVRADEYRGVGELEEMASKASSGPLESVVWNGGDERGR